MHKTTRQSGRMYVHVKNSIKERIRPTKRNLEALDATRSPHDPVPAQLRATTARPRTRARRIAEAMNGAGATHPNPRYRLSRLFCTLLHACLSSRPTSVSSTSLLPWPSFTVSHTDTGKRGWRPTHTQGGASAHRLPPASGLACLLFCSSPPPPPPPLSGGQGRQVSVLLYAARPSIASNPTT